MSKRDPGPKPVKFREPFYESLVELSKTRTNWQRHVALLELGAKAGDDQARYALGSLYLHGSRECAIHQDVRKGMRLLRQASRSAYPAMLELAVCYESGEHGVRRSEKKAFILFCKAADFGSVAARYHLGRCHYFGIGTPMNRAKGMRWYRRAFELGFRESLEDSADPDRG